MPSWQLHTRTRCEISGVFIVNFKTYFTSCLGVSIVNFEQVNTGWVLKCCFTFFRFQELRIYCVTLSALMHNLNVAKIVVK